MKILNHLRKLILTSFIAGCISFAAHAQSSVGINTTNPSPNAVLELVSPNNNQGLKIPSLTTTQRTDVAFVASLTTADNGLIVFDSDMTSFYYWNGTDWTKISKGEIPSLEEVLAVSNSAASKKISDLANPENAQDAATKKYIDDSLSVVKSKITNLFDSITYINTSISDIFDSLTLIQSDVTNLYDSVSTIQNSISIINDSITNISNDITVLNDSITNITNDIKIINDSIVNISNNVTVLQDSINNFSNYFTIINDSITNISNDITVLNDSITNITNDIKIINDSIVNISNNVTVLQDSINNFSNYFTIINDSITNISNDITVLNDSITNITNDIKIINDSIVNISNNVTVLQDSINNFSNYFTIINDSITNISNDITVLNDSITNITNDIKIINDSIVNISNNVTVLQDSINNFSNYFTIINDSITNISNDITVLNDSITNITNDIKIINDSIVNISNNVTVLQDSINNFSNYFTIINDSITNISNDISIINDSIVNLSNYVNILNDSITNISNQVTNLIANPNFSLAQAHIFVGDGDDTARAVTVSGDIAINSAGQTSIQNGVIQAPQLDGDGSGSPLTNGTLDWVLTSNGNGSFKWTNPSTTPVDPNNISLTDGNIFVGNISDKAAGVPMQGDATIINNGTITIANNAITSAKILDGTIATVDIANNAITTAKILDGTIATADLANNSVTSAKIVDATIVAADIADGAVTSAKILDGTIANADLDKVNIPLSGFGAAAANVSLGSNKVINVADPTLAQDAATKNYVDTKATSDLAGKANVDQTMYIGTTTIAINRASAAQSLTGITSIDGSAATLTTARLINGSSFNGSANITVPVNSTLDNANAATMYPLWTTGAGNNPASISTTKLSFVPSTGILTATGFAGSGAGLTGIPNTALSNSNVTIGTTAINLGASSTTLAGLTSVTSTSFVGALTGNATTATSATTATNIAGGLGGSIPYQTAANTTTMLANGTAGQVLTSAGGTNPPTWTTVGAGTVTTFGFTNANGFSGTVSNANSTPNLTVGTSITGILKGNGTAISAATSGVDYQAPITLTTTGSSGASTLIGTTLNVPNYTLAGLGGITLTSLSASLPLSYNNGTGAFSIALANGTTNGYISSADWTIFNNKMTNPMTTTGDIIYGGAAAAPTRLAGVATGNALISGGVGTAPSWGKIGLATHVSGILPIANGGTALSTTPTNGQLLIGNGANYTLANLTGTTSEIGITNAAGSITLGIDKSATLAANPAFAANGYGFGTTGIIFEGATANNFEGLLTSADVTVDQTWTLPNASGTLALTTDIPSVPTAANPSASIGLTATNGTAITFMRSDAAPALNVGITPTWTGAHIWSALGTFNLGLNASGAAINLNASSNNAVNIGTGTSTGTVTLGGTGTQAIAVGNGAGIKTVTIGSTTTTSTTTINAGSGNITLTAPTTTIQTTTATHDQISILPYSAGAARFAGTITSLDLTAARTWTLPNASGTIALTTDIPTVPTAANPSASIGLTATNGTAITFMRSDAAPALNVGITPTWTGAHIWSALGTFNLGLNASGADLNFNNSSNFATNINTGTSTGQINIGGSAAQTINVGTGAAAKTITIGNTNTTTVININSGTNGINLSTGAATSVITTLGTTGAAEFRSSTANSDRIRILPQSTAVGGQFTGTITSADLTVARTWTLPNTDGTFLMASALTTNNVPRWNGSALGNSSLWDDGSGHVHIGNSTISASYALQVTGAFKTEKIYHSSDARWKQNILPIDNALSKVQQLRGVSYEWRTEEFPEKQFSKGTQIGLIAQEVEKVLPELVITDDTGYKAVEYSNVVAVLIEAIKEQQVIIDAQKREIEKLQVSNTTMQQEISQLQSMQAHIESMQTQMNSMQALLQILQPTAVQTQK